MKRIYLTIYFWICVFFEKVFLQCPNYICNEETMTMGICNKKIIDDTNISYQMERCQHDYLCDLSTIDELNYSNCKQYTKLSNLFPGENCLFDIQCYSNKCIQEKCVGKEKDDWCQFDTDCDTGFHCYKRSCEPYLMVNNTVSCDVSPDTHHCHPNLACAYGKCVELASLENGMVSQDDFGCKSGFTFLDINTLKHTCTEGFSLENSGGDPTECPESKKCFYSGYYNGTFYEYSISCRCGYRKTNSQLCPLGMKQLYSDFQKVINYVKKYNPDCHINRRWFCYKDPFPEDYFIALAAFKNLTMSEDLLENDICSKAIYTYDYWNSLTQIKNMEDYRSYQLPSRGFTSFLTN